MSTLVHEIIHDPAVEQDAPLQTEEHLAKVLLDEKYIVAWNCFGRRKR